MLSRKSSDRVLLDSEIFGRRAFRVNETDDAVMGAVGDREDLRSQQSWPKST